MPCYTSGLSHSVHWQTCIWNPYWAVTFVHQCTRGWSVKIKAYQFESPNRKQAKWNHNRTVTFVHQCTRGSGRIKAHWFGSPNGPPLGRPRFAVLYLRGPISNPRILEQRYDTFFVMMLFYVDLSPKKLCSKHCFRRSARLGSLFSSPKLPSPSSVPPFLHLCHDDYFLMKISDS